MNLDSFDTKPYTLGGAALAALGWIGSGGNLLIPLGIMGLALRAAKFQTLKAEAGIVDADFISLPKALPPVQPEPVPVAINNTFAPSVTVRTPEPRQESRSPRTEAIDLSSDREIETVNTPVEIAHAIHDGTSAGHILFSCRTGSGKTTTFRATMRALWEVEPDVQFVVADPKGSDWMRLDPRQICRISQPSYTQQLLKICQRLVEVLQSRIEHRGESEYHRIVLVLDEWPSLLTYAEMAGCKKPLLDALQILLLQGREDKINLWIMGQSHLVQDVGFNRNVQANFDLFALGKPPNLDSVRAMASDQYIVRDPRQRPVLLDQIANLESSYTGSAPLVFSSINGGRISVLPDLRNFTDWTFPEVTK